MEIEIRLRVMRGLGKTKTQASANAHIFSDGINFHEFIIYDSVLS